MKRVVITGMGAVTPLSNSVIGTWNKLIAGECGIISLDEINCHLGTDTKYDKIPSKVAAIISKGNEPSQLQLSKYFSPLEQKRLSPFVQYALIATQEAINNAQLNNLTATQKERIGVCVGSDIGNMDDIYNASIAFNDSGMRKISPHFVPKVLINLAAGHIAIKYGFQGPNHAVSTACTTGAHSIGDAMRFIQYGDADVMIAGGSEASISPLAMAGFAKARSLSTNFNHSPNQASRPFDKQRDGFVIGEGAGIIILEEYEHAVRRNVPILCEIVGYGLSCDAHHITSPPENGNGAIRSMARALQIADISPEKVGFINAHATSTELGDLVESRAINHLFGSEMKVTSTKGATGHLLGAAGAVEAIFTIMSLIEGVLPPTLNLHNPSTLKLDYIAREARDCNNLKYAITNSFGFGGTNASLLFKKI